jgi:hypothetical protein
MFCCSPVPLAHNYWNMHDVVGKQQGLSATVAVAAPDGENCGQAALVAR